MEYISSSNKPIIIMLLGPPGSGKGTQAKQLTGDYDIPQISTGDLFRQHISNHTPIGEKVQAFMQAGHLVPDEIVLEMLFERIQESDCAKGYLLDGFPRTLSQAEILCRQLNPNVFFLVLSLDVPDEVIVKRTVNRLVCKQCGAIYNQETSPPKILNQCDTCQGEVYCRADDKEEVIRERLKVYHQQTQPLIKYYTEKNKLKSFDGTQPPQLVHMQLNEYIHSQIK